jgi:hypothetical protein
MSKWEEWKKNLGDSRPWHLLDPGRIVKDASIIKSRLDLCMSCEFFLPTKQCSKCLCYMPGKTTLSNAECPIGKWHREDQE